ncbi:hypothetical protein HYN49_06095 [Flavobacterium pallidum]|uniref:Uncharacterized protein n=2 Tax=Flavobacterium pallidum TaxID=2172098 RepID=A0A2S1SGK5_9FLAO|nr:hypothetical protein HYN49_06095 [Flavobacterium pallidum]
MLPLCGAFAQTKDVRPGVYESNSMGTNFLLRVNDNNTYELVFLHGDFEKEGDTLRLKTKKSTEGDFAVTPVATAKNATALTLTFRGMTSRYFLRSVFIGTQHSDSRPPEYKSARDYIKTANAETDEYTNSEPVSIKIDRTKYLYLLNYKNYFSRGNTENPTIISKFEIPDDVSEVDVEFDVNKMGDMNFRIYKNEKDQLVMTEGKSPLVFVFKEENGQAKASNKLSAQLIEDKDFAKNAGFVPDSDEILEGVIEENTPSYTFKYTIDKSFTEAQKAIAKSKNKFLVVDFDYENKNSQADFDKFIKRAETELGYAMNSEYVESEDHFNFYHASDKDKNQLSKNKLDAKKPQILIYNADGDLIYHTSSTLKKSGYFSSYNSIYSELKQADDYLKFDRAVSNKKATVPELAKIFRAGVHMEKPYAASGAQTTYIENEAVVEAVDTTTAVYDYEVHESVIGDRENLYKLKTTPEAVKAKWAQIVAFYKKSNAYNQDYIDAGLNEISNNGLTSKLFSESKNELSGVTFDFLDYVFAHRAEIKKAEAGFSGEDDTAWHYDGNDVDSLLNAFFGAQAYAESVDKPQQDKLRDYYKKYVALSGGDPLLQQSYFYFVQNGVSPETEREYLDAYAKFFNSVIKSDSSIIENLDRAFSDSFSGSNDWQSFKYEFANTANNLAWYVVEHRLGPADLKEAIRWSEASLRIEIKNAYYLDTLAQLYYLNGQKQKAIFTEERAASAAGELDDPEIKLKYEEILQKMKQGTY